MKTLGQIAYEAYIFEMSQTLNQGLETFKPWECLERPEIHTWERVAQAVGQEALMRSWR